MTKEERDTILGHVLLYLIDNPQCIHLDTSKNCILFAKKVDVGSLESIHESREEWILRLIVIGGFLGDTADSDVAASYCHIGTMIRHYKVPIIMIESKEEIAQKLEEV